MELVVLPITAGVLCLLLLVLLISIITVRRSEKITIGTGNSDLMTYRTRGHANFTENVPIALILLGILEYNNYVPQWLVIALSVILVIGRCMHAFAFLYVHPTPIHLRFRAPGMAMTLIVLAISGFAVLVCGIRHAAQHHR